MEFGKAEIGRGSAKSAVLTFQGLMSMMRQLLARQRIPTAARVCSQGIRHQSTRPFSNHLPGLWVPNQDLAALKELGWTDTFSTIDANRLRTSGTGHRVVRAAPTAGTCLGTPLLAEGTHDIALYVTGDAMVVGMAEANDFDNPWHARAWGVKVQTGEQFECQSMASMCEAIARIELSPYASLNDDEPDAASDREGTVVRMRYNSEEGSLQFTTKYDEWDELRVEGVSSAMRPWALFSTAGSPNNSVELLTHSKVVKVPKVFPSAPLPQLPKFPW